MDVKTILMVNKYYCLIKINKQKIIIELKIIINIFNINIYKYYYLMEK